MLGENRRTRPSPQLRQDNPAGRGRSAPTQLRMAHRQSSAWKEGGRPRNPDGPKLKSLDSRCSPSNKIITQIQQDDLKVAEIITMGFENNLIKDDVGNIEVNAAVIERTTGLSSYGADFPP
ncbi:hypothetical protein PIB30_068167 [Stylosanthes scabra]|uniref:Uncharacterized protein n=1 Tax=Stylosanthes scabra TaxID=79078 RepID=A0ABU6WL31_9FABA|nr:hypothetical protein [Stylosanthes scabra]